MKSSIKTLPLALILCGSASAFADSIVNTSRMAGIYLPAPIKAEMINELQSTCAAQNLSLDIMKSEGLYRSEKSYLYTMKGRCYSPTQISDDGREIKLEIKDGQWQEPTNASDVSHQAAELRQLQVMTSLCASKGLRLDVTNEIAVDYAGSNLSVYTLIGVCTSSSQDKY